MAAACVSGAVLSSLFHEHLNSSGDQEGFLLGQIVSHVKDTITDSQISGCKVETITNVYSFIPCPYSATFYDRNGEILRPKLDSLLQGRTKELIGWYKFRRNSTARMSLKERSLHHKLMRLIANGHQEHFLFCLCTSTTTPNTSTHNFDHTVQVYVKGMFKTVPLTVSNLGDSVQSQYKHRNNMTVNHAAGVYSSLVSKFIPEFTDDSGQIHEVNKMNALAEKLQSQLKLLYGVVSDSERQLQSLESELKGIRSRCESKREKERLKQPLPPSPDEPCSNFLPVDMDSAGPPPYSASDQKPAQESVFVPEADSGEVTMVSPVDQAEIVKDRSREMKKVLEDKKKLVEPLMPIKAGLSSDKAPADTTIKEGENSIEVSIEQMKKSEPDNNKAGDHFSFIDSVLNEAKVSTPSRSSSVRLREKTRTDNLDGTKLNDQETSAPSKPQTPLNTSRNEGDSTELNSSLADTNAPSTIDRNDKLRCKPVQRTRTRSLRSKSTEEPDLSLPDTEKSSEKADIAFSVATGKGDDPIVLDSDGSVTPLDQTSAVNEQVSKVKSTGTKKKTRTHAQVQAERAAATAAKSLNTPKQSALPTQATGVGDTGFTVENTELINNSDGITNESISTLKEPSTLRGSSSPVF